MKRSLSSPGPWVGPLPVGQRRMRGRHLHHPEHATIHQPLAHPAQCLPPIVIGSPCPCNQLRMWSPCHRADQHFNRPPSPAIQNPLSTNNLGFCPFTMLVSPGLNRNTTRHGTRHPVRCQTSPCQFCHPDRHAFATHRIRHSCQGSGDNRGILVGAAADLVPATIDLTTKPGTLDQDIFKAIAAGFLNGVGWRRQFQLRLFHPERPFQNSLYA